MAEQLEEVTVHLTNQKVKFTGMSKSNPDRPIAFDYKPPLGDGQGYNGLELLLMSLSGCSATAIVYLLRKMGKDISGLKVNAKGVRREPAPDKIREDHSRIHCELQRYKRCGHVKSNSTCRRFGLPCLANGKGQCRSQNRI